MAEETRQIDLGDDKHSPMETNTKNIEILSIEQFAERMQISRTTVFDWIKKGILKTGRHYIKIGRVIRFEWGQDLLDKLREDSESSVDPVPEANSPALDRPEQRCEARRGPSTSTQMDLAY